MYLFTITCSGILLCTHIYIYIYIRIHLHLCTICDKIQAHIGCAFKNKIILVANVFLKNSSTDLISTRHEIVISIKFKNVCSNLYYCWFYSFVYNQAEGRIIGLGKNELVASLHFLYFSCSFSFI